MAADERGKLGSIEKIFVQNSESLSFKVIQIYTAVSSYTILARPKIGSEGSSPVLKNKVVKLSLTHSRA